LERDSREGRLVGLKDRLRNLEGEAEGEIMTLRCPKCGEEFVGRGDVAAEYIVYEWSRENGEKGHHKTPEDIVRLFDHEHDVSAFVEKSSGLPFLSREVSVINLGGAPERGGYGA
jgi:hypothetical protein